MFQKVAAPRNVNPRRRYSDLISTGFPFPSELYIYKIRNLVSRLIR